jgi:superfamily I DNA/RNA helicase
MESRDEEDEEAGFVHYEEERRIAYVALTRARKECTFLHADKYRFAGSESSEKIYEPSAFLGEMGVVLKPSFSTENDFDTMPSFDIKKIKTFLRAGM